MPTLSGQAPAKVNLGLKILERGPNGYHELRTVFQTISLSDALLVSYAPRGPAEVKLVCDDSRLCGASNLAALAAARLLDAGGWKGLVSIELRKKIPVGAGLGGGSTDAAAVLLALRRLLEPPPAAQLLLEVAADLGSDVPFFLVGGTAVGLSRGDEVYPLPDRPRQWMLVLAPEIEISTADAYREFARSRDATLTEPIKRHIINCFCAGVSVSGDPRALNPEGGLPSCFENDFENDFEDVVFRRYPDLEEWKNRLVKWGASRAILSGSGSALFGIFPSRRGAIEARSSVRGFPGKVFVVRTMSRRAYRRIWNG